MKKASESENFHDTMGYSTNQPAIVDKSHDTSSDQPLLGLDHRIQSDCLVETAAQKLEDADAEAEKRAKTGMVLQRNLYSQIHRPSFSHQNEEDTGEEKSVISVDNVIVNRY